MAGSKLKRVLDKTSIDDKLVSGARKVVARTTVDNKLISGVKKVKHEIRGNIAKAVLAAFGFLIALVWRDVVKDGVDKLIAYANLTGDGYVFTLITALVTTLICVIGIIYFSRWSEKS
ncbi:MAG: hypothetical protein JXC85_00600 [Candidatus Aenigmarchaeota archaeon]|nr:hypothetical protein [Candidatus Aenigmarchaeota archaeon]